MVEDRKEKVTSPTHEGLPYIYDYRQRFRIRKYDTEDRVNRGK